MSSNLSFSSGTSGLSSAKPPADRKGGVWVDTYLPGGVPPPLNYRPSPIWKWMTLDEAANFRIGRARTGFPPMARRQ